MKKYIETKVNKATPMTRGEFNKRKGMDIPEETLQQSSHMIWKKTK